MRTLNTVTCVVLCVAAEALCSLQAAEPLIRVSLQKAIPNQYLLVAPYNGRVMELSPPGTVLANAAYGSSVAKPAARVESAEIEETLTRMATDVNDLDDALEAYQYHHLLDINQNDMLIDVMRDVEVDHTRRLPDKARDAVSSSAVTAALNALKEDELIAAWKAFFDSGKSQTNSTYVALLELARATLPKDSDIDQGQLSRDLISSWRQYVRHRVSNGSVIKLANQLNGLGLDIEHWPAKVTPDRANRWVEEDVCEALQLYFSIVEPARAYTRAEEEFVRRRFDDINLARSLIEDATSDCLSYKKQIRHIALTEDLIEHVAALVPIAFQGDTFTVSTGQTVTVRLKTKAGDPVKRSDKIWAVIQADARPEWSELGPDMIRLTIDRTDFVWWRLFTGGELGGPDRDVQPVPGLPNRKAIDRLTINVMKDQLAVQLNGRVLIIEEQTPLLLVGPEGQVVFSLANLPQFDGAQPWYTHDLRNSYAVGGNRADLSNRYVRRIYDIDQRAIKSFESYLSGNIYLTPFEAYRAAKFQATLISDRDASRRDLLRSFAEEHLEKASKFIELASVYDGGRLWVREPATVLNRFIKSGELVHEGTPLGTVAANFSWYVQFAELRNAGSVAALAEGNRLPASLELSGQIKLPEGAAAQIQSARKHSRQFAATYDRLRASIETPKAAHFTVTKRELKKDIEITGRIDLDESVFKLTVAAGQCDTTCRQSFEQLGFLVSNPWPVENTIEIKSPFAAAYDFERGIATLVTSPL